MAKQILFDDGARQKMRTGIQKLARTVRVTLGPAGRNVILQKSFGNPHVTKDGVSVSKEIDLEDPFENMGAKLVNEVANKTNDVAGDGTTTATVLADAIYSEGLRYLATGVSTIALRNGIDKAVTAAVASIEGQSRPVASREDKANIATISANNDATTGELLAEAFERVGDQGVITIEEGSIGGFGDHVLHYLALAGLLDDGKLKVRPMVLPDKYIEAGTQSEQYEEAGLTKEFIQKTVLKLLGIGTLSGAPAKSKK